uniref:TYMS opposite strand protein n=1 Tax=Homo sapiens TaxID=9606 RepID=TYMOS_HUMAN|eukprot:NP_001012734.2 TYMS opposite strand protein [Homo sapiens]
MTPASGATASLGRLRARPRSRWDAAYLPAVAAVCVARASHVPNGTLRFGVCKARRTMRPLPRRIEVRTKRGPQRPAAPERSPQPRLPPSRHPSRRGPRRHLSGCSAPACRIPTGCRCPCGRPS